MKIYIEVESALGALIHATLKTESFRRAYTDEYARIFSLTQEQKAQLLETDVPAVPRIGDLRISGASPGLALNAEMASPAMAKSVPPNANLRWEKRGTKGMTRVDASASVVSSMVPRSPAC